MNSQTVNIADHPRIARLLQGITRKRKCILVYPVDSVTLSGTYWSGGSRTDYSLCNMRTGQMTPLSGVAPPQFGGPSEAPRVQIPEGSCVISTGTFCGRPSAPTVYLRELPI